MWLTEMRGDIMPWSIPAAQVAGLAAGIAAGEVAGEIAKELGASQRVEARVRRIAHTLASAGVRLVIHAGMADPVGAASALVAAPSGAWAHEIVRDLRAGDQVPAPNPAT
jgi:hypothetical protein